MNIRLALPEDIEALSKLSVKVGNIPFPSGKVMASLLLNDDEIVGFVAVQQAWHAAGSWVKEEYRKQGHTYEMRRALDDELRRSGAKVYFAIPGTDFERQLFAKYGHTTEQAVQVRHL